jgi:hypothetical protein
MGNWGEDGIAGISDNITGWTGLVAKLIQQFGEEEARN